MPDINCRVKCVGLRAVFLWGILGLIMLLPATAWAGSHIVKVPPPNHSDDTANIQGALDACVAWGPGCTVQLTAGTYNSTQLFAENFYGTVKGMGMDATIIEVLTPLEVTVTTESVWNYPPSRTNKYPTLLIFVGGDITVSDMTFKVSDFNPVTSWCNDNDCGQTWLQGLAGAFGVNGNSSANFLVERVAFEGGPGTDDCCNNNNGPFFIGSLVPDAAPLTGKFKVVSSRISYSANGLEVWSQEGTDYDRRLSAQWRRDRE